MQDDQKQPKLPDIDLRLDGSIDADYPTNKEFLLIQLDLIDILEKHGVVFIDEDKILSAEELRKLNEELP